MQFQMKTQNEVSKMRHLSNIQNPNRPESESLHYYSYRARFETSMRKAEWQNHLDWIRANIVGPPQETPYYSQEKLIEMGMIGIYSDKT